MRRSDDLTAQVPDRDTENSGDIVLYEEEMEVDNYEEHPLSVEVVDQEESELMLDEEEQDEASDAKVAMTYDDEDPNDPFKPEGTIYLDIDCFSKFCTMPSETQQRLSKPDYVRGLPWKILAIPRDNQVRAPMRTSRSLGFFLQCNSDADTNTWNCAASATLRIISQAEGIDDNQRRISHTFYPKENDWGYSQFITCDVLLDPANGFIKDDTVKLKIDLCADAPHGVQWDSKKHTGFIGLKNQGATCYMNSILQTFYFTNKLRKAVFEMPTIHDDSDNNVALAMQRVFYDLQHSDAPVGTKKLTKSFGWDSMEIFMQHDVQELCRVLLDNLESKMKDSQVRDTIPNLLKGRMKSYIRCTDIDFESSREEDFYDIQLNVKDKNDIYASFREYTAVERLDGENKYDAGDYGFQPAEKGVKFTRFPPVLHLQLMRFQYDPNIDANVKINDRFEFPDRLNLNEFVVDAKEDYTYCLHAVLVHSGDFHGGHYVVFINTSLGSAQGADGRVRPKWCKFDDDVVSRASVRDATVANYGGDEDGRTFTNAYMLVYIRESMIRDVLCPITDVDIPKALRERFENERIDEIRKKKEKMEAHLYTDIYLVTKDILNRHYGFDLVDESELDNGIAKEKIERSMTLDELYEWVEERIGPSPIKSVDPAFPHNFRLWRFESNSVKASPSPNPTLTRSRPSQLFQLGTRGDLGSRTVEMTFDEHRNIVFVEMYDAPLTRYNEREDILIFVKYYDVHSDRAVVCGYLNVNTRKTLSFYLPMIRKMCRIPPETPLRCYEELAPDHIHAIEGNDRTFMDDDVLLDMNDGCILVFENANYATPEKNAKVHLETMYHRAPVEIVMNSDNLLAGSSEVEDNISGTIQLDWSCEQMAKYISERLKHKHDADKIMLWKMTAFNERPMSMLSSEQFAQYNLHDVLGLTGNNVHDPRRGRCYRVCYSKLPLPVRELDKRRQMKVQVMDDKMNIQEITLFPEKNTTVAGILDEAVSQFPFSENGSGRLRMVFVGQTQHTLRVFQIFLPTTSASEVYTKLQSPSLYMQVRIEEIPQDQVAPLGDDELLLPVAHFDKDPSRMFGVPFYIKVKNHEPFSEVKARIQKMLDVPDKEFEKYRFAIVASNRMVRYLDMDPRNTVNLAELSHTPSQIYPSALATFPYLGIDHLNKSRGARSAHPAEKPIIIHN